MLSCRNFWSLITLMVLLIVAQNHQSFGIPVNEKSNNKATSNSTSLDDKVIVEDVIPDAVDMDQKKVIRVNPLELPLAKEDPNKQNADSSLIKIQTIKPYKPNRRRYVNSQNMRKTKPQLDEAKVDEAAQSVKDSTIVQASAAGPGKEKFVKPKHEPKKKHLHFLYNQGDLSGKTITRTMPVHVAPGAYPVYYVIARTNGRFGKYPVKSFSTPEAFTKYLHKKKIETSEQS